MSAHQPKGVATLAQLSEFDEIVDARSPAEFADDHVPGAVSCPVLDDAQRAHVGTVYRQVSPFAAKKIGAALVARNIADHLAGRFADRDKHWRPLIYCWRGGQRSGAFVHILREIGWDAHRLEGGYKRWRQHVLAGLEQLPGRFRFRVISGPTGSGKSRLLEALAGQGGQTLHLEELAAHKGSVLGRLPDQEQPSQRMFETRLFGAFQALDPARPVFVEAESRRIGTVQLPNALIDAIRAADCLLLDAPLAARVGFLLGDYDYFLDNPHWLIEQLNRLRPLHSQETVTGWIERATAADYSALIGELLERHYDPLYRRSQTNNYRRAGVAEPIAIDDLSPAAIGRLAAAILSRFA